ncbi:MAG TPA: PilZ domain-containing protein [Parvularculaceae bacterium]|nr:PilZ domain-containing protein [Parvularculaceae bacterium]
MAEKDRRKHRRRPLGLSVRFVAGDPNVETTGHVIDISEGGLAMLADTEADIGDAIIAYPQGLGRLTGKVVRRFDGGIAIQFNLSATQHDYLAKRLEAAERGMPYVRLLERRAHERLKLNLASEALLPATGETFECYVIDISESGAGIRAATRPPVGALVEIGALKGAVRRHTEEGFGIELTPLADARECA